MRQRKGSPADSVVVKISEKVYVEWYQRCQVRISSPIGEDLNTMISRRGSHSMEHCTSRRENAISSGFLHFMQSGISVSGFGV